VSYTDVPEFVLRDCPLCGRVSVLAAKGCHERRYRIYCSGLTEKPQSACSRETAWWHMPEAAEVEWNLDHDVPLPLFPEQLLNEKTG
jgi:hypothetical protein